MLTIALQSGSNGNSIYVEADDVGLLFDAGISGSQAAQRLAEYGRDIRQVAAVIVSHDHADHVRCAGIYHRKFGLPLFMTPGTLRASRRVLGKVDKVDLFDAGQSLSFGAMAIHTLPTAHDAEEGVAFVVEHNGKRLGILTDLGHPFLALRNLIDQLDAAYIESNYDPAMLARGPYPYHLKARIRGQCGHLSNDEAAELACSGARAKLQWVAAAHLSEQNNEPELALEAHRSRVGRSFPVHVAQRYGPSAELRVE